MAEEKKKKVVQPVAADSRHLLGVQSNPTPDSAPPKAPPIRTLSSFVDVNKLKQHNDSKEIELIWRARHSNDSHLCAAIPTPLYRRMMSLARHNPMMVLPLPRESGIEFHFIQFKFPEANVTHILLTSLLEYKAHNEFARPHTTVMHFEDLAEEKGIVLMRGEVDGKRGDVGLDDARVLLLAIQKLYGADPKHDRGHIRQKLVQGFNKGSMEFNFRQLMDELERID